MAAYRFRHVNRSGTVLDVRRATTGRVEYWRLKRIGIRSSFIKLSHEDCSIDVSMSAASAVDVPFAENHNHTVPVGSFHPT